MFPSKMFEKSSIIPLMGVPHIMKLGMQKNVRFVGESLEKSSPIVQIDGILFGIFLVYRTSVQQRRGPGRGSDPLHPLERTTFDFRKKKESRGEKGYSIGDFGEEGSEPLPDSERAIRPVNCLNTAAFFYITNSNLNMFSKEVGFLSRNPSEPSEQQIPIGRFCCKILRHH